MESQELEKLSQGSRKPARGRPGSPWVAASYLAPPVPAMTVSLLLTQQLYATAGVAPGLDSQELEPREQVAASFHPANQSAQTLYQLA